MDASTLPVAMSCPSTLNAPARQFPLCDVTYAVSYRAGSGAVDCTSVSNSKSKRQKKNYNTWKCQIYKSSIIQSYNRSCGKESTKIQITQNKGKVRENSYQKIEEISIGKAHANTRKFNRTISTVTAVFLNQKRVNVCEHTTKMASLESF